MGQFEPFALMAAEFGLKSLQQRSAARGQESAQREAANARIAQIRETQALEERRRRERLRRAMATQRARFGAQGLGAGGSAAAVLRGLEAEAGRDDRDSRALVDMRIGDIERGLAQSRRRNLLEASQMRQDFALGAFRKGLPKVLSLLEI